MKNKYIVITTINLPTKATKKFCQKNGWNVIIVGDTKTPHEAYKDLEKEYPNVSYLLPEEQEKKYKSLSDLIGWKSIDRRNIGFVEAYKRGADIVASVDDDNIPYDNWGEELYLGKEILVDCYETKQVVFDPLSITSYKYLWHRGFPVQLLKEKNDIKFIGKVKRRVLVQANLWNGDPDIDAMARLIYSPEVNFDNVKTPYCSNKISPFNSQNTFISREVLSHYFVIPHIGRMDDIWGAYYTQRYFPNSVIYDKATVYQDRNVQDLVTNLENELLGYRYSLNIVENLDSLESYLSDESKRFILEYQKCFK